MFFRVFTLLLVLSLSACSWFETAKPEPVVVEPPKPKRNVVAEIRAEAAKAGEILVIMPVQSPAVSVLLDKAMQADERGNFKIARQLILEAEEIEPSNPLVVQFKAESQLRFESFAMAEILAQKSFDGSAQTGPLCMRNWLTIAEARAARADLEGEAAARARALECPHKQEKRL